MRTCQGTAAALLVLALVGLTGAVAQKETDKADAKAKPETKEKLQAAGQFAAKVVRVDGEQKILTVQVTYVEVDPGKVQGNQRFLAQRQLEIARLTDARERLRQTLQLSAEMQRRQADIYRPVHRNVELVAADDIKVRQLLPPVEFDDKGKPRKLTEKEKKDLRGPDPTLPGYAADFDNLKPEQLVRIYLSRKRGAPRLQLKEVDPEAPAEANRPQVAMVVILADPGR